MIDERTYKKEDNENVRATNEIIRDYCGVSLKFNCHGCWVRHRCIYYNNDYTDDI